MRYFKTLYDKNLRLYTSGPNNPHKLAGNGGGYVNMKLLAMSAKPNPFCKKVNDDETRRLKRT